MDFEPFPKSYERDINATYGQFHQQNQFMQADSDSVNLGPYSLKR
jgi:hypothetical protein